jgi:ribonuclease T1
MRGFRRLKRCGAVALIVALAHVLALAAAAGAEVPAMPSVAIAQLPPEAQRTVRAVREGGPFRYERDGAVFGNFEGLLQRRARGYYREYTVETPGLKHRGARRIVAGAKGELYYTDDHYRTFRRMVD